MQAIQTRYYGPTNTRPARIRAKCAAKTIWITYDYEENIHRRACDALVSALGWNTAHYGAMACGEFDGATYWVFTKET